MSERTAPAVGIRLKSMREAKGIPLRRIANATKIGTHALEAVERGDLSKLPGGIYTRAVIRSYASSVGLDPEDTLAEFMSQCPGRIEPVSKLETGPVDGAAASWRQRLLEELPTLKSVAMPFVFAIAAGYAAYLWVVRPDPVLPSSPINVLGANAVPVEPAITRVAHLLTAERPAAAPDLPAGALTVELRPEASCWVSLGVDGARADSRLLEPGERVVIEAEHEVVLKVGDAGAVALWINGRPAQPLGESGKVATVRISADTIPQFLGS